MCDWSLSKTMGLYEPGQQNGEQYAITTLETTERGNFNSHTLTAHHQKIKQRTWAGVHSVNSKGQWPVCLLYCCCVSRILLSAALNPT